MKFNMVLLCVLISFTIFTGMYFPIPMISPTVPGLVTKVLPAVVELQPESGYWRGAGVFISGDGWIMTAGHVVADQEVMIVTMQDGSKHMSINIISDPNSDIAILKIDFSDPNSNIETVSYVRMSRTYPQLGEPVFTIGHPLGMLYSISLGIVSNVHQDVPSWGLNLIVTDAEVTYGNSGGPLLNMDGRLVGIIVAGSYYFTGLEQNFAVPVTRGKKLYDEYIRQQEIAASRDSMEVPAL